MSLHARIRSAREAAGLDVYDLGKAVGCSGSLVRDWEWGHRRPGIFRLCRVSEALGVPVHTLLHGRRDVETDVLHLPSRATATVIHTPAW